MFPGKEDLGRPVQSWPDKARQKSTSSEPMSCHLGTIIGKQFAVEVEELELAELQLRRIGELPISDSCIQGVGVDEVPQHS